MSLLLFTFAAWVGTVAQATPPCGQDELTTAKALLEYAEGETSLSAQERAELLKKVEELGSALHLKAIRMRHQDYRQRDSQGQIRYVKPVLSDAHYTGVLHKHGVDLSIEQIRAHWSQEHRYFHTSDVHLNDMLNRIEARKDLNAEQKEVLSVAAMFHDIVYEPRRSDNKRRSAEYFIGHSQPNKNTASIVEIIVDNKSRVGSSPLSQIFQELDLGILTGSLSELIEWERAIFKEYQFLDFKEYKKRRLEFLSAHITDGPHVGALIEYVKTHQPKIAVFAGSFNPMHIGHLDAVREAEKLFDKVIIARGKNPEKTLVADTELSDVLPYYQTDSFPGFLTDYMKGLGYPVTLVRGLRNANDLASEEAQMRIMQEQWPEVQVAFVVTDARFAHLSSSWVRALEKIQPGTGKRYIVNPDAKKANKR